MYADHVDASAPSLNRHTFVGIWVSQVVFGVLVLDACQTLGVKNKQIRQDTCRNMGVTNGLLDVAVCMLLV